MAMEKMVFPFPPSILSSAQLLNHLQSEQNRRKLEAEGAEFGPSYHIGGLKLVKLVVKVPHGCADWRRQGVEGGRKPRTVRVGRDH